MENLTHKLKGEKLLPLYTATDLSLLDTVEKVLLNNGLSFIEVTYRSDLASDAIEYLAKSGKLIVGAGTVRNVETAEEAIGKGAQFIVTPGLSEDVLKLCQEKNIPCFPGAVTPTEIMTALSYGVDTVKFFPADVYGGLKAINALSGPFFDVNFLPTGGVNADNVTEFLNHPSVIAVGGSFIISEKIVAENEGETAERQLRKLIEKIK